jgi:hypothetical protein
MAAKRKAASTVGQRQLFPEALQDARQGTFDSLLGVEADRKLAAEAARARRKAAMELPGFAEAGRTVARWNASAGRDYTNRELTERVRVGHVRALGHFWTIKRIDRDAGQVTVERQYRDNWGYLLAEGRVFPITEIEV